MKWMALRRALHAAVDLIVDAIEEDTHEGARQTVKRPRAYARPKIELPPDVTPEERERVGQRLRRAGYETKP